MIPTRALPQRNHGNVDPGPLRRHADGERVDDVDARDVLEHEDEQQRLAARVRAAVGVEVVLDDRRVERRAVVERHAFAELDRPHRRVRVALDRLGEERLDLAVLVGRGQRVVDRAGDLDARDRELRLGEAPPARGLGLEAVGDLAAGVPACPRRWVRRCHRLRRRRCRRRRRHRTRDATSTSASSGASQRSALLRQSSCVHRTPRYLCDRCTSRAPAEVPV